ncbi:MAG: rhamnan synthesis F family protein [Pseudomonadota bacterium]
MNNRLIILAQFDPNGGLPAHVRIHLERLRPLAGELVLASNSPLGADRARAHALCDRVIERKNIGWDFAAWRDALIPYDMTDWDEVVLTNSSIIGPLFPLAPIFEEMAARPCDFWGMVKSNHRGPHLQSYFLAFKAKTVRSQPWRDFWSGVEDVEGKYDVIKSYEVGLTGAIAKAGFTYEAYIPNKPFLKSIGLVHINRLQRNIRVPWSENHINRTVERHVELIAEGMPYLKASLLWGKDVSRRRPLPEIKTIDGVAFPWERIGF